MFLFTRSYDYVGADKKRIRDDIPVPPRKSSLSAIPPHISGQRNRPQPSLLSIVEVRRGTIIVNVYFIENFSFPFAIKYLSGGCSIYLIVDY